MHIFKASTRLHANDEDPYLIKHILSPGAICSLITTSVMQFKADKLVLVQQLGYERWYLPSFITLAITRSMRRSSEQRTNSSSSEHALSTGAVAWRGSNSDYLMTCCYIPTLHQNHYDGRLSAIYPDWYLLGICWEMSCYVKRLPTTSHRQVVETLPAQTRDVPVCGASPLDPSPSLSIADLSLLCSFCLPCSQFLHLLRTLTAQFTRRLTHSNGRCSTGTLCLLSISQTNGKHSKCFGMPSFPWQKRDSTHIQYCIRKEKFLPTCCSSD